MRFLSICLFGAIAVAVAAGCSDEEEAVSSAPPPAPPAAPSVPSLTLTEAAPNAAGAAQTGAQTGATAAQTAPGGSSPVDFGPSQRPLNADRMPMSDLELLNDALEIYREKKAAAAAAALEKRTFNTEAEQMEAEAEAARSANATISDLSDLVRAGIIRAVPPAPAGKKYIYNPETQRIEEVDL